MLEILSPNRHKGRVRPVRLAIMHTMEVAETSTAAESVARQLQNPARRASAHVCGDNNSRVRGVPDADTAWAAPGANADGLQYELAGRAGQSVSEWADDYSRAALEQAAQQFAEWHRLHGIPIRLLTVEQVRDGKTAGFTDHATVTKAFPDKGNGHWDPGPNFPWPAFLARVAQIAGSPAPAKPATPKPAPTPTTSPLEYDMHRLDFRGVKNGQPQTYVHDIHVDNLQGLLNGTQRYDLKVDGDGGPATRDALADWQRFKNVGDGKGHADLIVGDGTWKSLIEY